MTLRRSLSIAAALGFLAALSGCDDAPAPTKVRDATPAASDAAGMSDASKKLLEAINTKQLEGGRLTTATGEFELTIAPKGSVKADTRIHNTGDTPVSISGIDTAIRADGVKFSGCRASEILQPGAFCDLFVEVTDVTGKPIDNEILVVSDAEKTPTLKIALTVEFEAAAQPAPDAPKPAPVANNIPYDQIAQINALRHQSGFGQQGGFNQPTATTRVETTDARYPEEDFAWTEASLPVDRKNILTSDRVIKAVLETPFNNIMCSQVIAVTDSDTWGADQFPQTDKPLLPAGTRFIGTCNAFTDERAAIVWTRFITPDGRSAKIMGAANDAMGRGGLPGHLDRRWFDKYGIPVIFSSLRSIAEYMFMKGEESTTTVENAETGTTTSTETAESRAINRFQGDMDGILGNIQEDLRNTKEVLTVPGGTRIDIVLLQDVYFKTPQTVVALGDDEYELPEKERQKLYRTPPQDMVAGVEGGSVKTPAGAQKVLIEGKEYWMTPAQPLPMNGEQQ